MNNDQFEKLFNYIQDFRAEINEKLENINNCTDQLVYAVDSLIG